MNNITLKDKVYKILNIENNIATVIAMEDYCSSCEFSNNSADYIDSDINKILSDLEINDAIIPTDNGYYYIPSVEEILTLCPDNNFSEVLLNDGNTNSFYMWTRTKCDDESVFIINGRNNKIEPCAYNDLCAIRIMFKIDLTKLK